MDPTGRIRRIATWIGLGASLAAGLLFVVVRGTVPSDGARVANKFAILIVAGWLTPASWAVRREPASAPAAAAIGAAAMSSEIG